MFSKLCRLVPALAIVILAGQRDEVSLGQERNDPDLRAALHELRDARKWLQEAKDSWPPGYKARALQSTEDAIQSIRTILGVNDLNAFRGVERRPRGCG